MYELSAELLVRVGLMVTERGRHQACAYVASQPATETDWAEQPACSLLQVVSPSIVVSVWFLKRWAARALHVATQARS